MTSTENRISLPPRIGQSGIYLAGRLMGEKEYSIENIRQSIIQTRNIKGNLLGKTMGPNLFLFQFENREDLNRVEERQQFWINSTEE